MYLTDIAHHHLAIGITFIHTGHLYSSFRAALGTYIRDTLYTLTHSSQLYSTYIYHHSAHLFFNTILLFVLWSHLFYSSICPSLLHHIIINHWFSCTYSYHLSKINHWFSCTYSYHLRWYISLGFLLSSNMLLLPLLESWFRDYLWFNSTPLIHGYSTLGTNDLSVQSWSFLLNSPCMGKWIYVPY